MMRVSKSGAVAVAFEYNLTSVLQRLVAVDDYARAYDVYCDAEGVVRSKEGDSDFVPHFEKRKKFDKLLEEFPKGLKTPVDGAYIRKLLRRARQNRTKRVQTEARATTKVSARPAAAAASAPTKAGAKSKATAGKGQKDGVVATKSIVVPSLSKTFREKEFDRNDF